MVADIVRPAGDETDKAPPVIGEQRPRRFLEACEIAGHHGHEMIGGVSARRGRDPHRHWRGALRPPAFATPPMRRRAACRASPNGAATTSPRARRRRAWAGPRPRGSAAAASSGSASGGEAGCGRRATISRSVPRRSRSIGWPVASLKMMIGGAAGLREACMTAIATSASGPVARRCGPMKAVKWGRVLSAIGETLDFRSAIFTRINFDCQYHPGKYRTRNGRLDFPSPGWHQRRPMEGGRPC